MKVLWMKPILPFPPRQGTSRVTLQLLRNLAGTHRVRLFARLTRAGEEGLVAGLEEAVPSLEVRTALTPNRRSAWHRAVYALRVRAAAGGGVPPVESYTSPARLVDRFRAEAEAFRPDLTVVEYWYAAPYLEAVPGPKVLFAHDVEYQVRSRSPFPRGERGRSGALGALEIPREKAALRAAPYLWFLTEGDRRTAVEELGLDGERSAVLPYGLDLERELSPRRAADPPETPESVLLFGSFQADFNRDALDFTLEEVWPALRRLRPRAVLRVAGGGLSEAARRRCERAGCRVEGEVADVRELLLRSAVVLVPLRFGGGLRIRLLESLALERAVVGTPVGVLGMGPRAESEVLVGQSADELAGQAARALAEPPLRRELGTAGRRWVETHHAMEAAARRQRELLETAYRAQTGSPGGV